MSICGKGSTKVVNRDGSLEYQLFSTLYGKRLTECLPFVHHDHHPARINPGGMAEWCNHSRTERLSNRPGSSGPMMLWPNGESTPPRNLRRGGDPI